MYMDTKKSPLSIKVLELIARDTGDIFKGWEIVQMLESFGFKGGEIDYPNTKWVTVLEAFKRADNDGSLHELISFFVRPLHHEPNPDQAHSLAKKIDRYLNYDGFQLMFDGANYEVVPPGTSLDEAIQTEEYFYSKQKEAAIQALAFEDVETLKNLQEYHRAYIDVLSIFCQDSKNPTEELNDAYLSLSKSIEHMVDRLSQGEVAVIDFYKPFAGDMYSAESEWNGDGTLGDIKVGPRLSWSAIRPKLNKVQSSIIGLIKSLEEGRGPLEEENSLDKIMDLISKHRTSDSLLRQEEKEKAVQRIEMTIKKEDKTLKKKIRLSDHQISFDRETAILMVGEYIDVRFVPYTTEHYVLRNLFGHKKNESVDWEELYEEGQGTDPKSNDKKDIDRRRKTITDAVRRINKKVKEVADTESNLLKTSQKSIERLY